MVFTRPTHSGGVRIAEHADASMVEMVSEFEQLVSGKVKPTSGQASEAVAKGEIRRALELEVARVGATAPALGVVGLAILGRTVAAENTTDQANGRTEFPSLDPGDVSLLFIVSVCHAMMGDSVTAIKPTISPLEAEPSTHLLSSLSLLVKSSATRRHCGMVALLQSPRQKGVRFADTTSALMVTLC